MRICATQQQAHEAVTLAYTHAKAMLANGQQVLIECRVDDDPLSIKQRRFLHGVVLRQISEKVFVGEKRERYTLDIWKRYFKERFLGFEWDQIKMPGAKRATPRKRWISTESLGVKAYSKFTNEVIDHAVIEFGIEFEFTNEEQHLLRAKPKEKEHAD